MSDFIKKIESFENLVNNTRLIKLQVKEGDLYAKLEFQNFMGSVKDRSAYYILKNAILNNQINKDTTVIESTSGNFGIALAAICKAIKVKFIAVVDPNITYEKEKLLKLLCYKVLKVKEKDNTGGYLLTRLKIVNKLLKENENYYHPNQYQNKDNYLAYYYSLGIEICNNFPKLDYVFISVSTGGTITGLSLRLKEMYKNIKIIAVDIEGSLIFGTNPKERKIPGLGASIRSPFFELALIDEVIILSQAEIIEGCYDLLKNESILGGGSSGAVYFAAKNFLKKAHHKGSKTLIVFPDHGSSYLNTIYNESWVQEIVMVKNH